ncbi:hypothetical protein GGI35DRAFT_312354 [Trichoderma velutinum]
MSWQCWCTPSHLALSTWAASTTGEVASKGHPSLCPPAPTLCSSPFAHVRASFRPPPLFFLLAPNIMQDEEGHLVLRSGVVALSGPAPPTWRGSFFSSSFLFQFVALLFTLFVFCQLKVAPIGTVGNRPRSLLSGSDATCTDPSAIPNTIAGILYTWMLSKCSGKSLSRPIDKMRSSLICHWLCLTLVALFSNCSLPCHSAAHEAIASEIQGEVEETTGSPG